MTNQEWAEHYQCYCRLKELGQIQSIAEYHRKHLGHLRDKAVYANFSRRAKKAARAMTEPGGAHNEVKVIKNLPALPQKIKPVQSGTEDLSGFRGLSVEKNGFIFKIHDAGQAELLGSVLQSCMAKGVL